MSASPPPSLPRAFLHSLHPHHPSLPSAPSPSPSPPGPLYTRLSNGSHSAPSPTNSRSSIHGVSFLLQIGLTRETVNLEASDLSAVKDLVCSIVDQKVKNSSHLEIFFTLFTLCFQLHMTSLIKHFSLMSSEGFPQTHAYTLQLVYFQTEAVVLKAAEGQHDALTCVLPSSTIFICLGFIFQSRHLGLVPQNESNTAEACSQQQ